MSGTSRTPERRSSTENILCFKNQRRYSKAYDQPLVDHTPRGPLVRIETVDEEDAASNQPASSSPPAAGTPLNPESSLVGVRLAKGGVTAVALVGIATALLGRAPLMAASELFGFTFMFLATFSVGGGLFLWWGSWGRDYVKLGVRKVLGLYLMCCISDALACLVVAYSNLGIRFADILFLEHAGYFLCLTVFLFVGFALFAHRDGLNALFSQEVCLFVGTVMVLNFSATYIFGQLLPPALLSQLVYVSLLFGLTLSLLGDRYPQLSLGFLYQLLRQYDPKVLTRPGNRLSGSSLSSTNSNALLQRMSYSSVSSIATMSSHQPSMMSGVDMDVVTEAHGMIGDLLMNPALGDQTQQKLRKVRELLAPRRSKQLSLSPRMIHVVGNQIAQDEHDYESDTTSAAHLPRHLKHQARRTSHILRRTSTRFSTTTTASGMPVVENEPLDRHRSLALRDVQARISVQEKRNSVHKIARGRLGSHGSHSPNPYLGPSSPSPSYHSRSPAGHSPSRSARVSDAEPISGAVTPEGSSATSSRKNSAYVPTDHPSPQDSVTPLTLSPSPAKDSSTGMVTSSSPSSAAVAMQRSASDRQPVAFSPTSPSSLSIVRTGSLHEDANLSIIKEGEEAGSSPSHAAGRARSQTLPKHVKLSPASGQLELERSGGSAGTENGNEARESASTVGEGSTASELTADSPDGAAERPQGGGKDGLVAQLSRRNHHGFSIFTPHKEAGDFALEEYSDSGLEVFQHVASWDFPIFQLEEKCEDHILSHMSYVLFNEAGLMETFRISQREFINYFRALEVNYGRNVYHNRTHASDVLHATSYLLFEMIPEFSHEFTDTEEREWKGHQRMKTTGGGNIASAFSILEVLACYMAAAMHDFDHPGRTNAFLVAIKSPLAVLYNDRSVLENHHAAASWDLLTSSSENNFLSDISGPELKRLRFLIIEAILATDLKMHFDILSEFKAKVNPEEGGGIDWSSEVDRLLVMKMIIKMADISTPAKSYDLHRMWTTRITEEFYQQSDEETELGLPPTIFMNRRTTEKLPAVQLSFIQNLVSPLFHACAEAGIIPGILDTDPLALSRSSTPLPEGVKEGEAQGEDEDTRTKNQLEHESSFEIEDEACMIGKVSEPAQKFMSIIITNLQVNYEGWQAELPHEEEETKERGQTEGEAATAAKREDGSEPPAPDSLDNEEETPAFSGHNDESTSTAQHSFTIPQVRVDDESAA